MGTRSDCRKHKKRKASLNALYYKSRQPKPLATVNIQLPTFNENCGTGAGGFQEGNTCARGGGVDSPAFKAWFGDSKVVDANGKPLVVYHVTTEKFTAFDPDKAAMGGIFWFTSSKDKIDSDETGAGLRPGQAKHVMAVHLSIQKMAGWEEYHKFSIGELKGLGYDGIKLDDDYVVFKNTQIKSVGNRGTYDSSSNINNQLAINGKKAASLQPQRLDPTRTGMIRRKWAAEIERRFNRFKKAVRKLIVEENAFGLGRRSVTGNYDPDQPRDDDGKWTDAGGGSSGSSPSYSVEFKPSTPADFVAARDAAAKRNPFLTKSTAEDLKNHKIILSVDGKVGAVVSPEGDIQNVFNNGGPKGAGQDALYEAIRQGGTHLDCFDDYLPGLYNNFGFEETGRMKFNRDYAPEGWDYDKYGEPDVVFMALKEGIGHDVAKQRVEQWQTAGKPNPVPVNPRYYDGDTGYDSAKADSISAAVSAGQGKKPGPSANAAGDSPGGRFVHGDDWRDRLSQLWHVLRNENCGTGAGGFQPGNTCAKGDGFPMSHGDAVRAGFLFHGMGSQSYRELLESAGFEMGGFSSQPQKLYGPKYIAIKKDAMPLMKFGMDNYQYTGREGREGFVPVKRNEGPDYYAIPFEHIYEADEHGNVLGPLKRPTANVTANRWEALSSSRQLEAFKEWVKKQIILDLLPSDTDDSWLGAYIKFAYQRGLARVFEDMRPQDDKTLDFYKGTKQEFLKSAFGRPVSQERVKLLTARTYSDLQGITDAMSAKLSRVLTDGMIQGKSPRDVARDIDKEIDGVGRARALTMARTETIRAHAEGQLDAMEAQGIDEAGVAVEWSTSEMGVTAKGNPSPCERCAPMAGVVLKVKESHGLIPLHPNAVFEGSTFVPYGDAHEIVRARYSGPSIVLRATDGHREYRTTIGPNHPMFSRRGLVKAAQLREGDEILYDRRHDPSFSCDVDHEQIPAVEDVFQSLLGDRANILIAAASSDLHGDRVFCHGEVEAVRPARSLLLVWDTLGVEQLRKENLVWADAEPSLASSDGALLLRGHRVSRTAPRFVSAVRHGRTFGSRLLRQPELSGVALASRSQAGILETEGDDAPRAAELFGNRFDRHPSVEQRRNLLRGDIEHGEFLWLKVTEVVESHFSGWAFDATTASSLYCNSGFVVKNCMCSWIPANVGEDTKDQIRTKSRIQKAIQASLDAEGVEEGDESDWEGQDLKLDKDRPKPLE